MYHRVLLKISGEAFMGAQKFGVDFDVCHKIASDIAEISRLGVQMGVVIGGGNIFRGFKAFLSGMDRTPADHIGMLSTVINGIAFQQAFEKIGCESRIMSAIDVSEMAEPYSWKDAIEYLNQNIVLLFVGGTGNPYFTTDTAAALRALEIQADILMKATKVDGIYNKDPVKYADAKKYDRMTYSEVLTKRLGVMDAAAIALCRDSRLPIRVFQLGKEALKKAILNEPVGTLVEEGKDE